MCRESGWGVGVGEVGGSRNEDGFIFHHTTTIIQERVSEFLLEQTFPTVQPKTNNPTGTCLILAMLLPVTAHFEKAKSPSTLPPSLRSHP